ncbi:MAG: lysylphosphatidylglycerol synthase transmembrane domain-containing protein [Anaerolineales bacterium]
MGDNHCGQTSVYQKRGEGPVRVRLSKLFASAYFRWGVGGGISILALYLALRGVAYDDVMGVFTRANTRFVFFTFLSVIANTLGKSLRWKVLIGPSDARISQGKLLTSLLAGQMLNLFPGRVGDLSRAYVVGGMGPGRTFVLGTVVLEKLVDVISYALLFFALLFLMPLPEWIGSSAYTFSGIAVFLGVILIAVTYHHQSLASISTRFGRWLPARLRQQVVPRIVAGLSSLGVLHNGSDVLKLVLWNGVVWGTAILNNHLALLALGIRLPLTASLLILIAVQAGISSSSVPGTIGVFEYLCVLALSVFGIGRTLAFGYGVLLHVIVLSPPIIGGLVSLWVLNLNVGKTGK